MSVSSTLPIPPLTTRYSFASRSAASTSNASQTKNETATTPTYVTSVMWFAAIATALSTAVFILQASRARSVVPSKARFWKELSGSSVRYPPLPASPSRIFAPSLRGAHARPHANRTVFVQNEACAHMYNYVCKFWFHVRCMLLGAFPNVVTLSPAHNSAISQFKRQVKPGDILVVKYRGDNHSLVPLLFEQILDWRSNLTREGDPRRDFRIGVFHIANERRRYYWPWYPKADFILRNYWNMRTSPHVQYIPLGGQVPEACPSERQGDSSGFKTLVSTDWEAGGVTDAMREAFVSRDTCLCDGVKLAATKKRPYLWSFSGSLRHSRATLVELLRKDTDLLRRGYIHVAGKFGGDGQVGSGGRNDPKAAYLKTVMSSKLVICPCGNVMETHRIYEALNHGAVPVIQKCEADERADFFPFKQLLIGGGLEGVVDFVRRCADDERAVLDLQRRVMVWWRAYVTEVALNVTRVMVSEVPERLRGAM